MDFVSSHQRSALNENLTLPLDKILLLQCTSNFTLCMSLGSFQFYFALTSNQYLSEQL